jgi:hypothetical protein
MAHNELAGEPNIDWLGDAQYPVKVDEGEHGKRIAEELARGLGVKVEYVRLE